MKYFLAISLLLFSMGLETAAYACTSKDDCQCWCKEHPDSSGCSSCFTQAPGLLSAILSEKIQNSGAASFAIVGTYCANPWDGNEGPNFIAAQGDADRLAAKSCYPYQFLRLSDYQNDVSNHCHSHFWGSKATATYSCASEAHNTGLSENCAPKPCVPACGGGKYCSDGECKLPF